MLEAIYWKARALWYRGAWRETGHHWIVNAVFCAVWLGAMVGAMAIVASIFKR